MREKTAVAKETAYPSCAATSSLRSKLEAFRLPLIYAIISVTLARKKVVGNVESIKISLAYEMKGLDSYNGGEFKNN